MPSFEQLRSLFNQSGFGMVLIGMPGLEKRAARYPQFFSRIGFVHEFRALAAAEVQTLLEENWTALASGSLAEAPAPDVRYSVLHENEQIFASRYKLVLPSEEELRKELERERAQLSNFSDLEDSTA
jgi:hypothetical protein